MDQTTVLIISIFAFITWIFILRWIIADSTQVKTMRDYKEKEIRLLILACRKLGASKEEVDNALNPK